MFSRGTAEDCCAVPKRAAFVMGLQRRVPGFWRDLNEIWRDGGDRMAEWMRDWRIVDQWLIDFVTVTIELWNRNPDRRTASSDLDYATFGAPPLVRSEIPDFAAVLDRPYLLVTSAGDFRRWESSEAKTERAELTAQFMAETLDGFRERMRSQFETQLSQYIKLYHSPNDYQTTKLMRSHADWTALAFSGLTHAEIAEWDLANTPHEAPAKAVRMAVKLFAKEIDLTLPTGREKPRRSHRGQTRAKWHPKKAAKDQ